MLQLVVKEKRQDRPRENYQLIELCDHSLSPVALAGDLVLTARYATPQDGDLATVRLDDEYLVRYWRQSHSDPSKIILSDGHGNQQIASLSEVLVLGVVREVRRPIVLGKSPQARFQTQD